MRASASTEHSERPRRSSVAVTSRSCPFAAETYSTDSDAVAPARRSGRSAPAQAAAMAAVSSAVAMAPPWTVSPIVASSGR